MTKITPSSTEKLFSMIIRFKGHCENHFQQPPSPKMILASYSPLKNTISIQKRVEGKNIK